jgi:hypothetical protein
MHTSLLTNANFFPNVKGSGYGLESKLDVDRAKPIPDPPAQKVPDPAKKGKKRSSKGGKLIVGKKKYFPVGKKLLL